MKRRHFLVGVGTAAGALAVARSAWATVGDAQLAHGIPVDLVAQLDRDSEILIASFQPCLDTIVLRAFPDSSFSMNGVRATVAVARRADLAHPIAVLNADDDGACFCARVASLEPATTYYYRFALSGAGRQMISHVGRATTAAPPVQASRARARVVHFTGESDSRGGHGAEVLEDFHYATHFKRPADLDSMATGDGMLVGTDAAAAFAAAWNLSEERRAVCAALTFLEDLASYGALHAQAITVIDTGEGTSAAARGA